MPFHSSLLLAIGPLGALFHFSPTLGGYSCPLGHTCLALKLVIRVKWIQNEQPCLLLRKPQACFIVLSIYVRMEANGLLHSRVNGPFGIVHALWTFESYFLGTLSKPELAELKDL